MGTITLSVPDELKAEMDKTDFINWSSVARRAFASVLADWKEMEIKRQVKDISGISANDTRQVKKSIAQKAVISYGRVKGSNGDASMTAAELRAKYLTK